MFDLVIFDFDGVVADTELAANAVLAEAVTALGLPTTVDHSLARYMGRRWADCVVLVAEDLGRAPPDDFRVRVEAELRRRLEAELRPVEGVAAFLEALGDTPRCVASSSSPEWLHEGLARMGLAARFGPHVFSAKQVTHGKPAPDLFLLAAHALGAAPGRTLVIEDSVPGVEAGRAAAMTTVGLCAGAHIRPGHAERLQAAGAHAVFTSYAALSAWMDVA